MAAGYIRGVIRYVAMIVVCLVVPAILLLVLSKFFRRLNQIERERWGDKAHVNTEESLRVSLLKLFRRKKKK